MAHVSRKFVLAALFALPAAQAAESPVLHYTVTPVLAHGDLTAVAVELRTHVDASGTLEVVMRGQPLHLSSSGRVDAGSDGKLTLRAAPNAEVTLSYERRGDATLDSWDVEPYMAASWMQSPCSTLLAMPDDAVPRRVELDWKLPAHWRGFSTVPTDRAVTRSDQGNSACFMGRDVVDVTRQLGNKGTLHAYTTDAKAASALIELTARSLTVVANTSGAGNTAHADYPMYIAPTGLPGDNSAGWSAGHFMAVVMARDAILPRIVGPIISDYAGMLAPKPLDPATAWYTQGLRSYLVVSDLLSTGTLSRSDIASYLDNLSGQYGNSPFRRASNAQVVSDWDRARDIQSVPLQRGLLFGWLLDANLRQATGGKACMADVLRHMDPSPADPAAALAAGVRAAGGGDITPLVDRYVVRGELLQLPPGALGPCMAVSTQADMAGWEVQRVSDTCTASP